MREALVQASYLLASVLFILSLKSLSRADTAARGVDRDVVAEHHIGPIETGLFGTLGPRKPSHNDEYLVDRCAACGYEWGITWLPPERREQLRRARRA